MDPRPGPHGRLFERRMDLFGGNENFGPPEKGRGQAPGDRSLLPPHPVQVVEPGVGHGQCPRPKDAPGLRGQALGADAHHFGDEDPGPGDAARSTSRTCSRTEAGPDRKISCSVPSGKIRTGFEPVVLARTAAPEARNPAAIRRVTLDLPRVPVTAMRRGTRRSARSSRTRSRAR